jgi:hypothetical protein
MIYCVIRDQSPQAAKAIQLRKLKAKKIRLHSIQQKGMLLDTEEKDRITGEHTSIHHYLISRKRRTTRTVTHVTGENGIMQMGQKEIMHFYGTYDSSIHPITIDDRCIKELVSCGINKTPVIANAALEQQITMDELQLHCSGKTFWAVLFFNQAKND